VSTMSDPCCRPDSRISAVSSIDEYTVNCLLHNRCTTVVRIVTTVENRSALKRDEISAGYLER